MWSPLRKGMKHLLRPLGVLPLAQNLVRTCRRSGSDHMAEVPSKAFQSLRLPDGRLIKGHCGVAELEDRFDILQFNRSTLGGIRALDIGADNGFFAFELEKCGARCAAIDCEMGDGFAIYARAVGSGVTYRTATIDSLEREELSAYDVILLLGVFQCLDRPVENLATLLSAMKGILVLQVPVSKIAEGSAIEILDQDNRFYRTPNMHLLLHLSRKYRIQQVFRAQRYWLSHQTLLFSKVAPSQIARLFNLTSYDLVYSYDPPLQVGATASSV